MAPLHKRRTGTWSAAKIKENTVEVSGRGTTRAEDAQETPTQSYISPSMLVHEEQPEPGEHVFFHPGSYQSSEWNQIVVFETPGVHCRSPDSGELRCKSRQLKQRDLVVCRSKAPQSLSYNRNPVCCWYNIPVTEFVTRSDRRFSMQVRVRA